MNLTWIILMPILVAPYSLWGSDGRTQLFPEGNEWQGHNRTQHRLAYELRSCFIEERGNRYLSGYARLKFSRNQGPFDVQLERSTFADAFVENCISSRGQMLRNEDMSSGNWSYAHIVSQCFKLKNSARFERMDCRVDVILNDVAENKELTLIIEKHWKQPNTNLHPYRGALDLILFLNSLSKK